MWISLPFAGPLPGRQVSAQQAEDVFPLCIGYNLCPLLIIFGTSSPVVDRRTRYGIVRVRPPEKKPSKQLRLHVVAVNFFMPDYPIVLQSIPLLRNGKILAHP